MKAEKERYNIKEDEENTSPVKKLRGGTTGYGLRLSTPIEFHTFAFFSQLEWLNSRGKKPLLHVEKLDEAMYKLG
jgi:hypothetical protein